MRQVFLIAVVLIITAGQVMAEVSGLEPPGTVIRIDVDSLPEPYDEPSRANSAERITWKRGMLPRVPKGFRVNVFAEGLEHPRRLLVDDRGSVYVAESGADKITYIRDNDGDGVGEDVRMCADDFDTPYGMAIQDGFFYVADVDHVWRLPLPLCQAEERVAMTAEGALASGWGHSTRNIAFSEDGQTLYVAVGSRGNIGVEDEPRATIRAFALQENSRDYWTYASGLRNPVGLVMRDGVLWTTVNERDGLGDQLVPDYLASVNQGDFFGWPYTYLGDFPQPGHYADRPRDKTVRVPEVLFRSHSAPLGFAFYDAQAFPSEYRGGAFVALHGSWNAIVPQGYLVAYVPFVDGAPEGSYQVFMSGFRVDDDFKVGDSAHVFGKPADVAVAVDGSLLIADDTAGVIWRVQWQP
ncbi:MAG: PQQ-dependent sugar dehydrogenase [Alphaproteobacteria bacterium GM202ARS2]|nr:PQQ-dependent sugar dehydrogenase [Alphaproteobacteria bacterium GM202ARS2]